MNYEVNSRPEARDIMALAGTLRLPESVLGPLENAASALPPLPLRALASPESAGPAWESAAARLPDWREDGGMAQLAATLAAAEQTRRIYREREIPEDIFLSTMDCLRRFLEETRALEGRWAFDRGFWTWRQAGGRLFRLGTLEFEYLPLEEKDGALPPGLDRSGAVLSVHIPSDAVLTREALDRSYRQAGAFFSGAGSGFCFRGAPRAVLCGSWLLAPALDALLPEESGIRRFAGDYVRYDVQEDDREFYRWLFGSAVPLPPEVLPERTGLQRAVKAHLAAGGRIGAAGGFLRSFP